MATLEWSPGDGTDVFASQFRPEEPYVEMGTVRFAQAQGRNALYADHVLKGDRIVGVSSGRIYRLHNRNMISRCSIDVAFAALGEKVEVLWGNPNTRQKRIRARVARFPCLNEERNESLNVSAIPCRFAR